MMIVVVYYRKVICHEKYALHLSISHKKNKITMAITKENIYKLVKVKVIN